MATFDVSLSFEFTVEAASESEVRAHIIGGSYFSSSPTLTRSPQSDFTITRRKPVDGRLIARLPSESHDRILSLMGKLTSRQLAIYGLCAKPKNVHQIFRALDSIPQFHAALSSAVAADITKLRNNGWLENV